MIAAIHLIDAKLIFCHQFIGFDKVAPVAIVLATPRVEILCLDLLPYHADLFAQGMGVFCGDDDFLRLDLFLFIGFNEIEFGADNLMPTAIGIVDQQFVKNCLSPVVASMGWFFSGTFQFLDPILRFARFIIHHIDLVTVIFHFVDFPFQWYTIHHYILDVAFNRNDLAETIDTLVVVAIEDLFSIFHATIKFFLGKTLAVAVEVQLLTPMVGMV